MEYTAPDGYVMEFTNTPVIYTINPSNYYKDGVYFDLFTEADITPIGIKQQRVIKTQNQGELTIEIRWSTEQELLDYIESVKILNELNNRTYAS